jgi:asparagine synthase (glutamine-hydrolysing)
MCGIAGYVNSESGTDRATLRRMTDSIAHRGPDGSGLFCDEHAALGHRRLSIIDVTGGAQPMGNEDGRLQIVYNGEIFNHAALRPDLERAGHRYQTRCDTETILHAYEEYGANCVDRFRGMFAFAIWDQNNRSLFCARDRLGIKPFYYSCDGRNFVFGSEIKALLEHPAVERRFNEQGLHEYLAFGYLSGQETLFKGIRKLMPGHHLTVAVTADGRLVIEEKQYWDIPAGGASAERDDRAWEEECRRRLEEAVRTRLMSDVPLGMFLSGGIDSSTIAAMMKTMADGPVKTFSVGYRETEFSELGYARDTAAQLGTDHHEVTVGMDEFFGQLPSLIWHEDEPITWPSSVSLYFVSRLASQEVKVVLTGEGSDELFGGYGRYRFYLANERLGNLYHAATPTFLQDRLRSFIATSSLLGATARRKAGHTFLGRAATVESLYIDNFYSAFSAAQQRQICIDRDFLPESVYGSFLNRWRHRADADLLSRLLYSDQKTYLVELLMKQDQMSMAASIESRVPFLDHTFVEFAATIPSRLKIRQGKGKYILRKAVEGLLPEAVLKRKKLGFPTPVTRWLLDSRADSLYAKLLDRNGFLAEYLDMDAAGKLVELHRKGSVDATDRIWRLINLQLWAEIFFSANGRSTSTNQAGTAALTH